MLDETVDGNNTENGSRCGVFNDDVNNEFAIEESPPLSPANQSDLDFISLHEDGYSVYEFSVDYVDNNSEESISRLSLKYEIGNINIFYYYHYCYYRWKKK